jgi:hypothetical protein
MPSLTYNFLTQLQENFRDFSIFVESGTFMGETIFAMENLFKKLYTIEINEELYYQTKSKYNGNKIKFLFGDSSSEMKNILDECNDKVIFFLDAHYSGGNTGNFKITTLYTPLQKEIEDINSFCKQECLIIVDDCRDLGTKDNSNWEHITESVILNIVKERLINYYYLDCAQFKNDRMILHLKSF